MDCKEAWHSIFLVKGKEEHVTHGNKRNQHGDEHGCSNKATRGGQVASSKNGSDRGTVRDDDDDKERREWCVIVCCCC